MAPSILADSTGKTFWMPEQASSYAGQVDFTFYLVLWIATFFAVLITVTMIYFVIKYRARSTGRELEGKPAGHSTALELTWTIVPTVLVLVIFYSGFRTYLDMAVAPPNAYEVIVNGKMWDWTFTYPNGVTTGVLVVPKDRPVRLVLTSDDVIHSFFCPQFRVKKDAVPGRFNTAWFTPTKLSPKPTTEGDWKTGGFDVYCAEYCGTFHSQMRTKVHVMELADFERWLASEADWEAKALAEVEAGRKTPVVALVDAGKKIYSERCASCHDKGLGPSWQNLYGYERPMNDGSTVLADEAYVRESIFYPGKRIAKGFGNNMNSFLGALKDKDVLALIAYMRSLSDRGGGTPTLPESLQKVAGGGGSDGGGGPATGPATAPAAAAPATQPNR